MANKPNSYSLELIIPVSYQSRINKLVLDTRTSKVKSENIMLNNMTQQDSIIYTWTFNNTFQLELMKRDISERLANDYFTHYHMAVV